MSAFKRIRLTGWRQFADVDVALEKQVTVLTGSNGSGKTTILNTLSRHFGWNISFVSTPFLGKKKQKRFWSDVQTVRTAETAADEQAQIHVGDIEYADGSACRLKAKRIVSSQYQLIYEGQQPVIGLHIPSHRPVATYHKIDNIPTDPKTVQQHYQDFHQLLFQTYGSSHSTNPGIAQKKSIIALALFGYGNQAVTSNAEYKEIFEQFQDILDKVLPAELGFRRLEIRMPEVVLVTASGEFSLDAMSGGINALFGIAWQIHMYGAGKDDCTITIDEPENHLHPSMQRSVLPSLSEAFPKYRFIVATHSPFVVSSAPESSVYGLTFESEGGVRSQLLDSRALSGTPNKVLREILGVPSNLPVWVEKRISDELSATSNLSPSDQAASIYALLTELGVSDAIPGFDMGRSNA